MKFKFGGTEYSSGMLDLFRLTIGEARAIKRETGLTIADWRLGMMTMGREDPDVLVGLMYLLKTRAGEDVDWDVLNSIDAQELISGVDFDQSDRVELTQFLPTEVDWMALAEKPEETPAE